MNTDPLNILVCPLDWGLGHASRMIPLIRGFLSDGNRVILAGSGRSAALLMNTFPDLPHVSLPTRAVNLGSGPLAAAALALRVPGMICSAIREHFWVKRIVRSRQIHIVVSDNRYGLFCRTAYSVFVTHQVSPVLPRYFRWLEYPLYRVIAKIILQYDACWIPDSGDPVNNLSGRLSHRYPLPANARFIGILSRFRDTVSPGVALPHRYDFVAVLSGPEPQVSGFEDLIRHQLGHTSLKALIINGLRNIPSDRPAERDNVTTVPHLEDGLFARTLRGAGLILCRSGYSAIMDLVQLGLGAVLVPTPGQTEQEYLAVHLERHGCFFMVRQKDLDLKFLPERTRACGDPGFPAGLAAIVPELCSGLYREYRQHGEKAYKEA